MKIAELRWKLFNQKYNQLMIYGLKNGLVSTYSEGLIAKLRTIYMGAIPASIILLSNGLSNGYCYERATLLARAFLDTEDDINLIYASVDSLRLNPKNPHDHKLYADHCFLERITKSGRKLIYDTSAGLVFDKKLYWQLEHPRIRKINNKQAIREYISNIDRLEPENFEEDKYASVLILPILEMSYSRLTELYSNLSKNLLKREIDLYKAQIKYPELEQEIEEDMRRIGLKRKMS